MRIIWSETAIANLTDIRRYIEQDKPEAARELARRILTSVERLSRHPHLGHAGREPDIRELIIGGTPYIIVYQVSKARLVVLAVLHASQERPEG